MRGSAVVLGLAFWMVALLFVAVPELRAGETVRIVAERTEVRQEASPGGTVLGTVGKGTVLQVLGREGGWVRVAYPIGNGAFYAGYIPGVFCEDARGAVPSAQSAAPAPPASAQPAPESAPASVANMKKETAPSATPQLAATPISSARPPARIAQRATGPIRVCVSPPKPKGGFVDTSKDVRDSVKDIEKRLRGKQGLVLDCTDLDVAVVVQARGVGAQSLGYAGGFAANSQGAAGAYSERHQIGEWVAVVLFAREGDEYKPVKELVGNHAYEESNAYNPYASLGAIGGWGDCANQIAKDVIEWVTANRQELLARRPAQP